MIITSKNYKLLLIIPVALMLFSISVLVLRYSETGEWFKRSFELTGGTMVTIELTQEPDMNLVEESLSSLDVSMRVLSGFSGSKLLIQAASDVDTNAIFQALQSMGIDTSTNSVQTIGPSLGESFWQQTQLAFVFAFVLMGIVVFVLFRDPLPCGYVIACAFFDIVVTLAFMNIFGIELSLAGLGAILMLLGYSVDSDIMLTSRFLKEPASRPENRNQKTISAVKTGVTMTGTTLGALAALYITAISPVITEIASVLILGLIADLLLTWFQNAVLIRMYAEKKGVL